MPRIALLMPCRSQYSIGLRPSIQLCSVLPYFTLSLLILVLLLVGFIIVMFHVGYFISLTQFCLVVFRLLYVHSEP